MNSSSDRELVISRIIDAPRERVFEAWTSRTVMRSPDGTEYPTKDGGDSS